MNNKEALNSTILIFIMAIVITASAVAPLLLFKGIYMFSGLVFMPIIVFIYVYQMLKDPKKGEEK